jgi:hypothetical protein
MLIKSLPPHYRTLQVQVKPGEDAFELLVAECRRVQIYYVDVEASTEANAGRTPGAKGKGPSETAKFTGECHYCHKIGHKEADCRKKMEDNKTRPKYSITASTSEPTKSTSSTRETRDSNKKIAWDPRTHQRIDKETVGVITCWFCGREGHKKDECPKLKKLNALINDDDDEDEPPSQTGGVLLKKKN